MKINALVIACSVLAHTATAEESLFADQFAWACLNNEYSDPQLLTLMEQTRATSATQGSRGTFVLGFESGDQSEKFEIRSVVAPGFDIISCQFTVNTELAVIADALSSLPEAQNHDQIQSANTVFFDSGITALVTLFETSSSNTQSTIGVVTYLD
jgi:hypothetical protein